MAMKTPSTNPVYATAAGQKNLSKEKLSEYMDFTTATFALTSREAFLALVAPYVSMIENKYALMIKVNFFTEGKIAFMKDILIPASISATNNLAKSGKVASINSAAGFRSTAEAQKNLAISYQNQAIGVLNSAKKSFIDVGICLENIKDAAVPAIGAKNGYDCGYWCRIIYLWDLAFSDMSVSFKKSNSLVKDSIVRVQTAANSIFDLDDAANGYNSFRNTHKELIAKEEYEEEKKQKKINDSKAFYEILAKKAEESPISTFIWPVINNLWETGNYYTLDDIPPGRPEKPAGRAGGISIDAEVKYAMDCVVTNLYRDEFRDYSTIDIGEMKDLASLCNGAYTFDNLFNVVKAKGIASYTPKVVTANFSRLAAIDSSALSTSTATNAGKTQTETQIASDKKAKEIAEIELENAKKEEDAKKIAEKEAELLKASVAIKEAEEAKKKEEDAKKIAEYEDELLKASVAIKEAEDAKKIAESKPPIGPDGTGTQLIPTTPTNVTPQQPIAKVESEVEKFLNKEIAGIKMPYIIGGGICLAGLIVLVRAK
jgi:hypothetical protein